MIVQLLQVILGLYAKSVAFVKSVELVNFSYFWQWVVFFIRPAQPVNATFGGEMNQTAGTLV
jgi:hypothetical protein